MTSIQSEDDVLVIVLDHPPVNAIGVETRQVLEQGLKRARDDAAIRAIVICGAGKHFSGGADITEFGRPPEGPALPHLLDAIEACDKPVIAAIHGVCFGGGLELALACHYRMSSRGARFALPEVKLGLLPGAGGTQRLPRLIGVQAALEFIVSGEPLEASAAEKLGLIDHLIDDRGVDKNVIVQAAVRYARSAAVAGPRRTTDRRIDADVEVFERFATANARKIKGSDAAGACIAAIRAATTMPYAAGAMLERNLFVLLRDGGQSRALRHLFFAERAAAKIRGLSNDVGRRPIATVGVIGAGTMGTGIALNFLSAGLPVTLVDMAPEALARGTDAVRNHYAAVTRKGRLTPGEAEKATSLLRPTLDFEALAGCDLVIEAVYEDMAVKQTTFARLNAVAKPGAILATNTSYLDIDEIAACTTRPQDVIGLHFFSPANVMKLLEVIRADATAPEVLATAMDVARLIGKVAVVAGVCPGFIGNRMLKVRQRQAEALVVEGATPQQVDDVHTTFGMPMGPFQMADLAGLDVGWHRDVQRIDSIKSALCAQGRLGQKVRAGFYDYDERRTATPSPTTNTLIDDFRTLAGITPRQIDNEEIIVRTLYTMVNEAARILEEGIAQQPSDIDVVYAFGYGWPRVTGGPLFWADSVGLGHIVAGLERYRGQLGPEFCVAPSLLDKARSGGRFING